FPVWRFQVKPGEKPWAPARYVAWVTPSAGDVRVVDLGPADTIDAAVRAVREQLEAAPKLILQRGEQEAEKPLRARLAALSKLVLPPLLPHVGRYTVWQVSPDGNLWLVPWSALLLPDGRYALEQHRIAHLTSGRDLLERKGKAVKPGKAVLLANPDFDL